MREVGILKLKPKEHVVTCFCGSLMKLRWAAKYQNWFYGCIRFPDCKGAHGCHPDGKPLGKPAPPEVKKWRIAAHEIFDRLWKNDGMKRTEAYAYLAEKMGVKEIHIGESDIETCKKIIKVCSK